MNKILVVADHQGQPDAALKQALLIASSTQSSIHVVQFIHEKLRVHDDTEQDLKKQVIEKVSEKLAQQLEAVISDQVEFSFEVVWQKHIHVWINEYASTERPSMVIKTGNRSESAFYTPTDWHLIRECPAPVLIAAESKWRKSPNVMAAIDIETTSEDKKSLNLKVIQQAKQLADNFSVDLYVCYAPVVSNLLKDFGLQFTDEIEESAQQNTSSEIANLSNKFQIPLENFIVRAGSPDKVIPSVAAENNAGLVVIGTVGRIGLSGKFIGNTAEKIMSLLKTDILAIKP